MNIFSGNCTRETFHYIHKNSLWLNRLFLYLSHKDPNNCLAIDCRRINKRGSTKFRAKTDNPEEEWCYLNFALTINNRIRIYLKGLLNKDSETDEPYFRIEKIIRRAKSG